MEFGGTFWVAVAFFLFCILSYKPVGGLIGKLLDERSNRIRDELDEAVRLKEEAQALLASYQRKQRDLEKEAGQIIQEAESTAKIISQEAKKELDESLNRRVEAAMQKIASHEAAALQKVKLQSVDIAMKTVHSLIGGGLNKKLSDDLLSKAMDDMSKKLN